MVVQNTAVLVARLDNKDKENTTFSATLTSLARELSTVESRSYERSAAAADTLISEQATAYTASLTKVGADIRRDTKASVEATTVEFKSAIQKTEEKYTALLHKLSSEVAQLKDELAIHRATTSSTLERLVPPLEDGTTPSAGLPPQDFVPANAVWPEKVATIRASTTTQRQDAIRALHYRRVGHLSARRRRCRQGWKLDFSSNFISHRPSQRARPRKRDMQLMNVSFFSGAQGRMICDSGASVTRVSS